MEERDAGGLRRDDVPGGVEDLLGRDRALVVVDSVDVARRDLPAAPDLEVAGPDVDVHGREPQPLPLLVVLDREVDGDLLDDVREEPGRRRLGPGERDRDTDDDDRNETCETKAEDPAHVSPPVE